MLEKSSEEIKSVITEFDNYQAEVEWDITQRCNYSCSYCESYNNTDPTQFRTLEEYSKAIEYIKTYFDNKNARIDILGGEPILFKQWAELLNKIHEVGLVANLTTNLSLNFKTLEKKIEKLKPLNCIDVSWHTQFSDDEKMLKNIKLLYETGHLRSISILGDKRYWARVVKAYNDTKFTGIAEISFIKDESAGKKNVANKLYEYSEEEVKYIRSTTLNHKKVSKTQITYVNGQQEVFSSIQEFFEKGITNFKGMKCEIGQLKLHIKQNGDVYPSACFLNHPQARLGNVFKENVIKPNKPITCPFSFCGCGSDLRISKYV
jgi:MoaA/NifB/PqqE/SkfB family radical SAM enzyme